MLSITDLRFCDYKIKVVHYEKDKKFLTYLYRTRDCWSEPSFPIYWLWQVGLNAKMPAGTGTAPWMMMILPTKLLPACVLCPQRMTRKQLPSTKIWGSSIWNGYVQPGYWDIAPPCSVVIGDTTLTKKII